MICFNTIQHALEAAGNERGCVTALYPSAGNDTGPFGFLHPGFLANRGAVEGTAPNAYVYVDQNEPDSNVAAPLTFDDGRMTVRTLAVRQALVADFPAWLLSVECSSEISDNCRKIPVVRIRAQNRQIYSQCAAEGFAPFVFIGVCDGCAFGGQDRGRCENRLDHGSPLKMLPQAPRWWVTDHFVSAHGDANHLLPNDVVRSECNDFPFVFRKVALLSTKWGHSWPPVSGATVFGVERNPGFKNPAF